MNQEEFQFSLADILGNPFEEKDLPYQKEQIKPLDEKSASIKEVYKEIQKQREHYSEYGLNRVFIEQGLLLAHIEDDYGIVVPCDFYSTYYAQLDYKQLRTYLSFRTKIRKGVYPRIQMTYVILYVNEIINRIGVESPVAGLEQLILLFKNYESQDVNLAQYLVGWIKDYYICNEFEGTFDDIIQKYKIEKHYPIGVRFKSLEDYTFAEFCKLLKYNVEDNKFLDKDNKELLEQAFMKVLLSMKSFLALYGMDFEELLLGNKHASWWNPFPGAVYDENGVDKTVQFSKYETYVRRGKRWTVYRATARTPIAALIIEYIMKRTEAMLREWKKYRYPLSPNLISLLERLEHYHAAHKIIAMIKDVSFDAIIVETTRQVFQGEDNISSIDLESMQGQEPYKTFMKMREVGYLYGSYAAVEKFQRQVQILESLTDDFDQLVPFEEKIPLLEAMTNDQLRCYITWRTNIQKGIYKETEFSYLHLYVMELINQTEDIFEGFARLADFLKLTEGLVKKREKILSDAVKEYYLVNDIQESFYEITKRHGIDYFYPNSMLDYATEITFQSMNRLSGYKLLKSKFYTEKTAPLMEACYLYVFPAVERYFKEHNYELRALLKEKGNYNKIWQPYRYLLGKTDGVLKSKKKVIIASNEIYLHHHIWTCTVYPTWERPVANLSGHIVKRMEGKMREVLLFKSHKFMTPMSSYDKGDERLDEVLQDEELDVRIDEAVLQYFREKHPNVFYNPNAPFEEVIEVKIDKSKLHKIRENADIIRDKLTLEEDPEEIVEETMQEVSESIEEKEEVDCFDNLTSQVCANLTELQKQVLRAMLTEEESMKAIRLLAQQNNTMPELLLEQINEIALDIMQDNLLEAVEEPFIYDEYIDEVKTYLEV